MVTYVDDFLMVGEPEAVHELVRGVRHQWETTDPEWLTKNSSDGQWEVSKQKTVFCGMEIRRTSFGGIMLSQGDYIHELLDRHQMTKANGCKLILEKAESMEVGDTDFTAEDVRSA